MDQTVQEIMGMESIGGTNFEEWIRLNPQDSLVGKKVLVDGTAIRTIEKVGKMTINLAGSTNVYNMKGNLRGAVRFQHSYITILTDDQLEKITTLWGQRKKLRDARFKIQSSAMNLTMEQCTKILAIIGE